MPTRKARTPKSWSMYPKLHNQVDILLADADLSFDFHEKDTSANCIEEYDTNIMGRFICKNRTCVSGGWSSKKIAITIRMYRNERYNARVYHQRCMECSWLSKPILDHSYAERVAYRLKKWSGVEVEVPFFSGESKGPHQSGLCEGCRNGHCSQQV